jgi:hypothetical protein
MKFARVSNITTGKVRNVKNLGWLLHHWKEVRGFELSKTSHGQGYMKVYLYGDRVYETDWGSYDMMFDWVQRPVFRGLPGTDIKKEVRV